MATNPDFTQPADSATWPCGFDCQYAATLADRPDWVRCQHPEILRFVVPLGAECRRFDATPPASDPPRS